MWRLVILSILLVIVYFMVKSAWRGFLARKSQAGAIGQSAEMVQDPVCGMYVTKEGSFFLRRGNHIHFFCSESCRTSYEKKLA